MNQNECWLYAGWKDKDGYGRVQYKVNGKAYHYLAHRFMYEHTVGELSKELTLDHLCRNRACINPDHLEPVTQYENNMRGDSPAALNRRKTHCPKGHEYTRVNIRGHRICQPCRSEWQYNKWRSENPNAPVKGRYKLETVLVLLTFVLIGKVVGS